MAKKERRPNIGRIQKVSERKKSRRIKAVVGIILFLLLVVLVIVSLKYDLKSIISSEEGEEVVEEEGTSPVEIDEEDIFPFHEIAVEVVNGTGSNTPPGQVRKNLQKLDIRSINNQKIIMPIDVSTRFYYVPDESFKEYDLLNACHEIKKKIDLPTPRRMDIRLIIGRDIPELHQIALSNKKYPERELNIEVLNGSGIEGAAGRISDLLRSFNYNVVSVRNADNFDHMNTSIHTGKGMKSISYDLSEMFGVKGEYIYEDLNEIIIVLGEDYIY